MTLVEPQQSGELRPGQAGAALPPADGRPASVVPASDGLIGLAALTVAWLLVMWLRPPLLVATWVVLLATALPMLQRELARAPGRRGERGKAAPLSWLIGFLLATSPFVLIHGQHSGVAFWLLAWIVVAPTFAIRLVLEARRNGSISGAFASQLGKALLPLDRARLGALAPAARLWGLKAFFIPLYALSLYALLNLALANPLGTPVAWLTLAVTLAYTIDLSFGLSGYLMASNSLLPSIRSTQTRLLGWVVCLACYGPVMSRWADFEAVVLQEISWPATLTGDPLLLAGAAAMLVLLVLYVWATVCFGLRFCNLSNRGLISHGPYRWMKHPAYFAHVANAWIITFVFMPAAGVELGLGQLLVPVAFTILYRLRSVTEEQHMSEDPEYVAYAAWIARHGMLARLQRLAGRRAG